MLREDQLQNLDRLRTTTGFCLLKPDAVELDVAEFIIAHLAKVMYTQFNAELGLVIDLQLGGARDLACVYPKYPIFKPQARESMLAYFTSAPSIFITFHTRDEVPQVDLWEALSVIKGRVMWHWTVDQLLGCANVDDFVRALVPLPGTRDVFAPIMQKIIEGRDLTDDEYFHYIQNLIHTPETAEEVKGLIGLLDKKYRGRTEWVEYLLR